jgi:outer membrane protein assembly factor BamB
MKISQNKAMKTTITMILVITMATMVFMPNLPTASAVENNYTSYIYVSVANSLIGLGQSQLIVTWTADMPPDIGEQTSAAGRAHWENVEITVTDPDGANTTLTIPTTDAIGGGYVNYIPEKIGTYTVQSYLPKQTKINTATNTTSYYSAARSPAVTFTAQQDAPPAWNESPLPEGYWSRPINSASRNWFVLGGNWLGGAHEQPAGAAGGTTTRWVDGLATESAHILWSKPLYVGGYMEERFEDTGYQTGHYLGLSFSAIVINGKAYYSYRDSAHSSQGYVAVDLNTGETLSYINDTIPSFGQIYSYDSGNQHGGFAYLYKTSGVTLPATVQVPNAEQFPNGSVVRLSAVQTFNSSQVTTGTLWQMLDASTLQTICYIANVSSGGTAVYGKDGSILRYNLAVNTAAANSYLSVWNSSAGTMVSSQTGTGYWQWRPQGQTFGGDQPYLGNTAYNYVHDGRDFYSLNVSIPTDLLLGPRNSLVNQTGIIQVVREGQYVIIGTSGRNDERGNVQGRMVSLSLEPGKVGQKLWDRSFTMPYTDLAGNVSITLTGVFPEDNVICFQSTKLLKRWGVSLETGQLLWESKPEEQNNYYTMITNYYNGMLLTGGYGGVILAYDIKTGEILWNFTAKNIGSESPYGNYPINIFAIADGKIYTLTGEHSITQPMWRGPNIRCLNATNGEEIWNLLGFGANGGAHLTGQYMQMADGKVLGLNYFDNKIYCIGKGSSATTVSAPQVVPALGSSVMIAGTVTDDTPGAGSRNANDKVDMVLKGTPAISDSDMGRWMEYLFMDQAKPSSAKGVPVSLDTIDPNGNFVHIGDVTSDINGNYGLKFTPEVSGNYQIIATFAGSKAYGGSTATTYLSIDQAAPTSSPAPTPAPESVADQYLLPATAGIIVAIAIATIVIVLALRKRP